jgi:hypothetical protein
MVARYYECPDGRKVKKYNEGKPLVIRLGDLVRDRAERKSRCVVALTIDSLDLDLDSGAVS